jgi:hypothetical protein
MSNTMGNIVSNMMDNSVNSVIGSNMGARWEAVTSNRQALHIITRRKIYLASLKRTEVRKIFCSA